MQAEVRVAMVITEHDSQYTLNITIDDVWQEMTALCLMQILTGDQFSVFYHERSCRF